MLLKKKSSDLNQDLNIMPVLDILSTLVVFLLLTAVWNQVGTFSSDTAFGNTSKEEKQKPSLVATFKDHNSLRIDVKDLPNKKNLSMEFSSLEIEKNKDKMKSFLETVKKEAPDITEGLVIPHSESSYENVIAVMDQINKVGITQLGLGYRSK